LKPTLKRYIQDPSNKEFNSLPFHLRYAYFSESSSLPIIISSSFFSASEEKKKFLGVLRKHNKVLRRTITDDIKC
jgi:hypothetical protein